MNFPYRQFHTAASPTVPSGVLHRTEIPLQIIGASSTVSMWALVDPGSDDTLLPLSFSQVIGAKADPNQTWKVEGIDGQALSVCVGERPLGISDASQTFRRPARTC